MSSKQYCDICEKEIIKGSKYTFGQIGFQPRFSFEICIPCHNRFVNLIDVIKGEAKKQVEDSKK